MELQNLVWFPLLRGMPHDVQLAKTDWSNDAIVFMKTLGTQKLTKYAIFTINWIKKSGFMRHSTSMYKL